MRAKYILIYDNEEVEKKPSCWLFCSVGGGDGRQRHHHQPFIREKKKMAQGDWSTYFWRWFSWILLFCYQKCLMFWFYYLLRQWIHVIFNGAGSISQISYKTYISFICVYVFHQSSAHIYMSMNTNNTNTSIFERNE